MAIKFSQFTFVTLLVLATSACSSRSASEIGCNFVSGATSVEYDEESAWQSNLFTDVIVGLFNVAFQGAHRTISPNTYDSCEKKDITSCVDSNGNIKKECTLTR